MDLPIILAVDDEPDNLTLLSSLLKGEFKVKVANSGEKALKIAQTDPKPALILLDILMPEMGGFEVCEKLKGDSNTKSIPVVFLSAKKEPADVEKANALGASAYLLKPVDAAELQTTIKNLI